MNIVLAVLALGWVVLIACPFVVIGLGRRRAARRIVREAEQITRRAAERRSRPQL